MIGNHLHLEYGYNNNTVKKTSIGCKTKKYALWDILALFY